MKRGTEENINYMFLSYIDIEIERKLGGPQDLYEMGTFCGSGNYAIVRQAYNKQDGKIYKYPVNY